MRSEVWTPQLLVGGSDVTAFVTSELHVSVQAGNARVLQFSCGLGTGGFSMQPADDLGKTVVLKINGTKVFTGVLSNFGANLDEGIVNYDCSDNYASSYARMAKKFETSGQLQAKWNKHLLGDKKSATDEEKYRAYLLQNDLTYSIAADGSDLLTHKTAAAAIAANRPLTAYTEDHVLMGHGDVSYSTDVGSNSGASKPVNQLVYEIAFRYPVAHELIMYVSWQDPYPYMGDMYGQVPAHYHFAMPGIHFGTKAGFEAAVNGLGYKVLGISYTPSKTGPNDTTRENVKELLMDSANARLGHRWVTYQTEYRTLVIQNKSDIVANGLHSEKRTMTVQAIENIFDVEEWCRFNAPGPELSGNGTTTHGPGWTSRALYNLMQFDPEAYAAGAPNRAQNPELIASANESFSVQDACDLAVSMAQRELIENQVSTLGAKGGIATTTLRFRVSYFDLPSPNIGWPATYNTSRWEARGIVNAMELVFGLDGSAVADVTLTSITPPNVSVPSDINAVIPLEERAEEQFLTQYDDTYVHNPATGLMVSTLRAQDRVPRKAKQATPDPHAAPKTFTGGGVTLATYCWAYNTWSDLNCAPGTGTELLPNGFYVDFAGNRGADDIPTNVWIVRTPPLPPPEDTIYVKEPQFFACANLPPDPFLYKPPQ